MIKIIPKYSKILYCNYSQAVDYLANEYRKSMADICDIVIDCAIMIIDGITDSKGSCTIGDTIYEWATLEEIVAEANRIASRNKPADILRVHCGIAND